MAWHYNRRSFLKKAGHATLAAMAARLGSGIPDLAFAKESLAPAQLFAPKADTLIVLWMAGGMAHTETFDPKPPTEYRSGLPSRELLSTFPSIDTVVDNIKFSKGLEGIGSVIDRGTVVRSYVSADFGPTIHTRHQYHWHTGYIPPQTLMMPHIGATLARTLGRVHPDIPSYIDIGQPLDGGGADELKAFMTAGFHGSEYGPLYIPNPQRGAQFTSPPAGMDLGRFENRQKLFSKLVAASPVSELGGDYHRESLLRALDGSYRLIQSPASKAFDLSLEPKPIYDTYNTGRFGLGCLLARRLTEQGARFIEVSTEYVPFGNWDTHKDGFTRTIALKQQIDNPIKQLVLDLEERGLLSRTLIVIASEFSRVAGRNPGKAQRDTDVTIASMRQYGMHRHFIGGGTAVLLGAGVRHGFVYGRTADEFPCGAIEKKVTIEDLHATIFHIMGIPPDYSYDVEQRPVYVTRNGEGKVINEILA